MQLNELPKDILNIILTYKEDLELLEKIPHPYNVIATELPYLVSQHNTTDYLILYIIELVTRMDLTEIPFDDLITTPHNTLIQFELAANLQERRLSLYNIDYPRLSPLWKLSLPYIVIEYITTSDVFQLKERLESYFHGIDTFPIVLLQ